MWILIALTTTILAGITTIIDDLLINKLFKNILALIFLGMLIDMCLLSLVFIFGKPAIPPLHLLPFILLSGFLEIIYLYPYFKALKIDDSSTVSSLFSLGRIFIPIFAFIIVGEKIAISQYFGFALIVISGFFLTLKDIKKLKLNKSFLYMLGVAIIVALDSSIYKYLLNDLSWSTTYVSVMIASFFCSLFFLLNHKVRSEVYKNLKQGYKGNLKYLVLEEFSYFSQSILATFLLSLVPVTIARGLTALTPFVVLFLGILLRKIYPNMFKDLIEVENLGRKLFLFAISCIGVILMVVNN